ncbi:MAG: ATPase [Prolixibacteraceae bacterium]|nr:ATPase [Prolixibacteraceae bacterium]
MLQLFNILKKKKIEWFLNIIRKLSILLSSIALLTFIYEMGFNHLETLFESFRVVYLIALGAGLVSMLNRYFMPAYRPRIKTVPFDLVFFLFILTVFLKSLYPLWLPMIDFSPHWWLPVAVITLFIRESAAIQFDYQRTYIKPSQLFLLSFAGIILLGSLLLLLPRSTVNGISIIDALFTSTSAVCVTGLIVVDTGSYFTFFGQVILLILIQIGGIGIMTFASYFSFFFRGVSSYENQIVLRDMTNTEKLGEVFSILKKIILITFILEAAGTLLIFQQIRNSVFQGELFEQIFFSMFHAVSAFCNAGFSTMQSGLMEEIVLFNYPFHLVIAVLIILGGLGFPIVFNLLKYLRRRTYEMFVRIFARKKRQHTPRLINVNSRIVLLTTLMLTLFGTLFFFFFEYNQGMRELHLTGKIVSAFFTSVTTRTAGFNTIDFSNLQFPSILIVIVLMWIGASPGSTGGGIKTSTFALAVMNIYSIVTEKNRIELNHREISNISTNRAFAIIILSLVVIFTSFFWLTIFDGQLGLVNILFECVSAYSTVGLSMGITAGLGTMSKIVLILTMFIGRISMLTVLMSFIKQHRSSSYRYPSDNILIN